MADESGPEQPAEGCPIEATLEVIGGKWKTVILYWLLRDRTLQFGDLRRHMPALSEPMLARFLRELEAHEIIHRKVHRKVRIGVPPQVDYSLTEYGRTLGPITELLAEWGANHRNLVARRRKTYESRRFRR